MKNKKFAKNPNSCALMNVNFTHLNQKAVIDAVVRRIAKKDFVKPLVVFTPNVEQLMQSQTDKQFLADLQAADIRIPDSVGLTYADWWRAATTGSEWMIRERVTGIDTAERLLVEATVRGYKVALIGGLDNAATAAAENLKTRFQGLKIEGVEVGEVDLDTTNKTYRTYIENINQIRPDILLVGLGAPKQERWVMAYVGELKCQAVMVVGGGIDVWAGRVKRAPNWAQKMGLEWLARLVREPWRWKRQQRLLKFGWMVLSNKV